MVDVIVRDEGTIVQFIPKTMAADNWFADHVETEPWQWLGNTLAVHWRYAPRLIEGIEEADLTIE